MRKLRSFTNSFEDFDLADVEWHRITSIAIPTLAGIATVQAFIADTPMQSWQSQLLIGNLVLILIGFLLEIKYKSNFSFLPLYLFMLAAPVLFGNRPSNSWMSIGLVCMAANIHIAGIQKVKMAVMSVFAITAYQAWVAFQNFPSVSDNSDIKYFYSYFASTWMVAIGVGTIFIRRRYRKVANNIRELGEKSLEDSLNVLRAIKRANQEDSNNLQLHGTVLNTLMYFKRLNTKSHTPQEIKTIITKELSYLKSKFRALHGEGIVGKVIELLATRSRNRIEVSLKETQVHIEDEEFENGIVEIIRELLLNLEKHSSAKYCTIEILRVNPSRILVSVEANTAQDLSSQEVASLILASKGSLSLKKHIESFDGVFTVSEKPNSSNLIYEVSLPVRNLKNTLQENLSDVRNLGLNDFSINFVRVSGLVGVFHLFGYAATGMELKEFLLIGLFNITLLAAIEIPKSKVLLILSTILSFLVIPFLVREIQGCENVLRLPWIFNLILTQGFLVTLRVKSQGLKWLPLFVLALQSFVYPKSFDVACQNIFAGSLPAIPLIAVLALTVLKIRKREFGLDLEQSQSIEKINKSLERIESDVNREYDALIQDLENFVSNQDFSLSSESLNQVYELQIQKIRSYLICAEQFHSSLVRNLYYFTKARLNSGVITRLSVHGLFSTETEDIGEIKSLIEYLNQEIADLSMDLTVIASNAVEVVVGLSEVDLQLEPLNFGSIKLRFGAAAKP